MVVSNITLPRSPSTNTVRSTRPVVSNIFYFHPYLGKIPLLTNIFSNGLVQPPTRLVFTGLCHVSFRELRIDRRFLLTLKATIWDSELEMIMLSPLSNPVGYVNLYIPNVSKNPLTEGAICMALFAGVKYDIKVPKCRENWRCP